MWHSAGSSPDARAGHHAPAARRSPTPRSAARRTPGRASSSSASASRSARLREPRRAGATSPTWLARTASRPEWKAPPRGSRHGLVAVPAQVEHLPLRREQLQREPEPGRRSRWCARPGRGSPGASSGWAKPTPSAAATAARPGSTSTSVTSTPGDPGEQPGHAHPTMPAPTTATRSPTSGPQVPQRVDRGLDGAGEHRPAGRHAVGDDGRPRPRARRTPSGAGAGRRPCGRAGRPGPARRRRRRGSRTSPGRGSRRPGTVRASRLAARRDAAAEDQGLGAAADAGVQGADQHLVGPGRRHRLRTELAAARLAEPERRGGPRRGEPVGGGRRMAGHTPDTEARCLRFSIRRT